PLQKILRNLSNYRFGHSKTFEPTVTKVKEFEELNTQIKQMIDRNEGLFEEQKLFLENASHELQTPLAITIGKLDLLLQEGDLPEEKTIKIAEAKQSLHRMVVLNKIMLMLSRIENKQYSSNTEVNFNDLIKRKQEELEDFIQFKELKVDFNQHDQYIDNLNFDLA